MASYIGCQPTRVAIDLPYTNENGEILYHRIQNAAEFNYSNNWAGPDGPYQDSPTQYSYWLAVLYALLWKELGGIFPKTITHIPGIALQSEIFTYPDGNS